MSARDDYPLTAHLAEHSPSHNRQREAAAALDEIDRLRANQLTDAERAVLEAAREVVRVWATTEDSPGTALDALCDAVDAADSARRETQS